MKTLQDQRREKRQAKLKHVQRQIKAGTLVVRQMTDEERRLHKVRRASAKS
jgi:hypothetical protein